MKATELELPGVLLIEPERHTDDRGYFLETFREERYHDAGAIGRFVQDNLSRSDRHVLRGLHFQKRQAKLVTVVRGEVYDVVVDIRPDSQHVGRWTGIHLSADTSRQVYVPPGFAHGFCVLSSVADVWYKTTDIYRPEEEGGIVWNDPSLAITWPVTEPVLSPRDRANPRLEDIDPSSVITSAELQALGYS